jgi:hypothetical protein
MPARLVTFENVTAVAVRQLTIVPKLIMALAESNLAQRRLQEVTIASQRDIIRELSTPIIPINNQVLVMPMIGTIDSLRAQTTSEGKMGAKSAEALDLCRRGAKGFRPR